MIDFDFSKHCGKTTFDDLSAFESKNLSEQINDLKEDMLQVEFPRGYLLDIGWRPSFNTNGRFHIVLIKNQNWETPAYTGTTNTMDGVKEHIRRALLKI
ncbi:MAG: hypothetical protein RR517_23830 [Pseudomonas sp.]